jgi:uracil-DNA glycosylase
MKRERTMRQGNKAAAMAALKAKSKALVREVYSASEKVVVFGEGNLDASIVLVGEAPGEQETLLGRPFVGKAGKNLDAFLKSSALRARTSTSRTSSSSAPSRCTRARGR